MYICIGTIPLRNLVYRVQDLPPRMKPLVYDFGQLNSSKERQYVIQIVSDHVSVEKKFMIAKNKCKALTA